MADFAACYDWMMDNEDAARAYASVPDAPPGAFAVSGVNSAAFPEQFAAIVAVPQGRRGPSVQAFYQANFWNKWYAQLASDDVAKRAFDAAVNNGPATAVRMLQVAVNTVCLNPLTVDGLWGPHTVVAANACDGEELVNEFVAVRCAQYRSIAAANPSLAKYLPAWLARASK